MIRGKVRARQADGDISFRLNFLTETKAQTTWEKSENGPLADAWIDFFFLTHLPPRPHWHLITTNGFQLVIRHQSSNMWCINQVEFFTFSGRLPLRNKGRVKSHIYSWGGGAFQWTQDFNLRKGEKPHDSHLGESQRSRRLGVKSRVQIYKRLVWGTCKSHRWEMNWKYGCGWCPSVWLGEGAGGGRAGTWSCLSVVSCSLTPARAA